LRLLQEIHCPLAVQRDGRNQPEVAGLSQGAVPSVGSFVGVFLFLLGFLLLTGILVDIFTTTLTARGSGFVTSRVAVALWGGATVHQRRSAPQLLTTMGSLITASVVLIWVGAMWAGWDIREQSGIVWPAWRIRTKFEH
jgi:hypothetical protein